MLMVFVFHAFLFPTWGHEGDHVFFGHAVGHGLLPGSDSDSGSEAQAAGQRQTRKARSSRLRVRGVNDSEDDGHGTGRARGGRRARGRGRGRETVAAEVWQRFTPKEINAAKCQARTWN